MSVTLRERQQAFMAYLYQQDDMIASHVARQGSVDTQTRLTIYRHAYIQRLQEAIASDHEILGRYLGDELLVQLVKGYIACNPSTSTSLRNLGEHLPYYLTVTAPFDTQLQIAELALFERLLLCSFDAADSSRAILTQLQQLPAEAWPGLRIAFHPSVQLFTSQWNSVEIWQALKAEQQPPQPRQSTRHWVLWRNQENLTEFSSIDELEHILLTQFLLRREFSCICDILTELIPEKEVSERSVHYLLRWLEQGLIQAFL